MYDNVGKKLKKIADIFCCLGIGVSVLCGITFQDSGIFLTLLIAAIGSFCSWLGFMCLYGFGELIEQTTMNREVNERILVILQSKYGFEEEQPDAAAYQTTSNPEYINSVESSEE